MSLIRNRVLAVIEHLLHENESLTIAKVCKLAEVNRANLYATYPDLITKIRAHRDINMHKPNNAQAKFAIAEPANLKQQLRILAYSCVELRTALDQEQEKSARLAEEISRLKKSR